MVVVFGVWVALAWQRSEIASLQQEKADLRGEIAAMTEVSQKMQSQGLKIEFGDCKEQRANAPLRRRSTRHATMGNRASAVLCAERVLRHFSAREKLGRPNTRSGRAPALLACQLRQSVAHMAGKRRLSCECRLKSDIVETPVKWPVSPPIVQPMQQSQ